MAERRQPGSLDRHPRDVLAERGIRPRKALGQNFMISAAHLDRVADAGEISRGDVVLEIGAGLGTLTARLAARAGRVVSVEVDRRLHEIAAANLREFANVTLLRCDFLAGKHSINQEVTAAAVAALGPGQRALKVVSNPPYSISSPAIIALWEWDVPVGSICMTLQREVADRLTAAPGRKEYGPLTVFTDYWATAQRLANLPPRAFWPAPEVSSTLVKIVRRPERRRTPEYDVFAAVVRRLFESRRKTLAHMLRAGWGADTAEKVIARLSLSPTERAENLTTADFEAIAAVAGPPRRA